MSQTNGNSTTPGGLGSETMAADGQEGRPTMRQLGEDLKKAAAGQAGKAVDQSKDAGADVAHAVGDAVNQVADAFDGVPSLAGYIRAAAEQTHDFADNLRDQKAGDLLASAVAWGQKQPLVMLAGAALLGAALSRLVKTGAEPTATSAQGIGAPPRDEHHVELGGRSE